MFGIPNLGVASAYLLCIASTILCVVYAWRNWNRGDEQVEVDDVKWAEEEEKAEEEL
jgi:hypothetical protein